jgi:hypothetical protein
LTAEDKKSEINLANLAEQVLAGQEFDAPKKHVKNTEITINNIDDNGNGNGKNNQRKGQKKGQEDTKDKEEKKKRTSYVQKYYSAKYGILAEAVLIEGMPYFLLSTAKDPSNIEIHTSLELPYEVLRPPESISYINLPYRFDSHEQLNNSIEEAKNETLDSLYKKNKDIWRKYVDADDFHISICAADEIYTYYQEKIGFTHYLFFTGGNDAGKSNNLTKINYTAYRNMTSTDISAPNIYQFLGSRDDEGHGTICIDEADNIDENPELMRICKNGYITGRPILKIDTSLSRVQRKYNTFSFKAFAAERTPDRQKAKGFNQRIVEIHCFSGNPPHDISEIVNPSGDQESQDLLDELLDFRNTLLIHKLLHLHEPIPDVKGLNIHNREKQLFKPLIRLFQKAECLDELLDVISEYLSQRRAANVDNLHSALFKVIYDMAVNVNDANSNTVELSQSEIWSEIISKLEAKPIEGKPDSYSTDSHGTISKKFTMKILRDVFGGKPPKRHGNSRLLIFAKSKLEKLENIYVIKDIEIKVRHISDPVQQLQPSGLDNYSSTITTTSQDHENNGSIQSGTDGTHYGSVSRQPNDIQNIENAKSADKDKEIYKKTEQENIDVSAKNHEQIPVGSQNVSHVSQPSPILTYEQESEGQLQDVENKPPATIAANNNILTTVSESIYRIGHSDIFGCENCKLTGDKWFMENHNCSRSKKRSEDKN